MKRLIIITLVAVFVAVMSSSYLFAIGFKVTICHNPGTDAQETLRVSRRHKRTHLRHGDTLGKCEVANEGPGCGRQLDHGSCLFLSRR